MEERPPAVSCSDCQRTWNSASMAEGLRLLGHCPRCNGELTFASEDAEASTLSRIDPEAAVQMAPHMVLGIPRR